MDDTSATNGSDIDLLRHTLATLAYRGGRALRNAPEGFSFFRAGATVRTPGEILAHICDLMDWGLSLAQGQPRWRSSPVAPSWEEGVSRFFTGLDAFDSHMASAASLGTSPGKIFQGPIADALTHIGQISILRRIHGTPLRAENFLKADIQVGRVGRQQTPARVEFD